MTDTSKDAGLIQVLAEQLESKRLPRALSLKEKVDRGATLGELDIEFLEQVFKDAQSVRTLLERHPECQDLAAKMIQLYKEITDKALENEKAKGAGS
jgi:hypothetical protein